MRNSSVCSTSNATKDTNVDINIDLDTYFENSHISNPFLDIKIPLQRRNVEIILGFSKVNDDPFEDTPTILQTMDWGG
jgi:hypothetical protein